MEFMLRITYRHNLESFLNDDLVQHGVTMALINIGESAKSLSKKLKQKHRDIKWQDITKYLVEIKSDRRRKRKYPRKMKF
jgi:uncharacterized protein with HEPN domain